MKKIGNSHSSLADKLAQFNNPAKPKVEFTAQTQKSLQEIFAQFNAAPEPEITDSVDPASTPIPDSNSESVGADIETAKQDLVKALIALCGGAEEAKACIDASSQPADPNTPPTDPATETLGQEPSPMPMPAPMGM